MDKNYKHATDMEERLRRASDAAIVSEQDARAAVAKWRKENPDIRDLWTQPRCDRCGDAIPFYDESEFYENTKFGDEVSSDIIADALLCLPCAAHIERRHSRDPVEAFNPTRWAVLSAVVILVIITLNVI